MARLLFLGDKILDSTDLGRGNKKLWQYKDAFRSGEDAVSLAHFSEQSWQNLHPNHEPKSILDIGCGAGMIISLLADTFPHALAFGIEKVLRLARLARRNLSEQGIAKRSLIVMKDARAFIETAWPWGRLDLIVCNPPYRKELPRDGIAASKEQIQNNKLTALDIIDKNLILERQVARFDFALSVEDLAKLGSRLMAEEGCFCLAFPLQRQAELIDAMEASRLFLNQWRRLCGFADKPPKIGLYCFTRWTGRDAVQLEDLILRESRTIEKIDS